MIELQVRQLGHWYGSTRVFRDVTFSLRQGDILGCVGRNGSGKSTLLRILAGLLVPLQGTVIVQWQGIRSDDPHWRRSRCGYAAPSLHLYEELTVDEQIEFHCACRNYSMTDPTIAELTASAGLEQFRRRYIAELSSGMLQRLKLILAFIGLPPLVILDEPTATLDATGIGILSRWIEQVRSQTIIVIATNVATELPWCSHIFNLETRHFSQQESNCCARIDQE
ncbi:MAG: ABC transporter ATP-binding protein [Bacteroidota bacterium]|nr:ABC transporter ATP-binding protein [Candidatus Kapabacteria bacterium]MCS7302595.1 ABC transporter ATP-binding protein [Candidatus Kapabacteria bacterium]MCX7936708.1 ABC transporter ATP-binding protein [Chlorobiota bacterium]MDW8074248.1 ABC transporter ATP-binding protein [Bacteroidota bacterium]MDW8271276.1 ABC transporter ATP-binding protein [Bacteroidota bacterium]